MLRSIMLIINSSSSKVHTSTQATAVFIPGLVSVALLNSCHYQHLLVNIVSVEINCDIISDRADKTVCNIKMAKFTSLIGGLFLSFYMNSDIYYFR